MLEQHAIIPFPVHAGSNGSLTAFQQGDNALPFSIGKVLVLQGMTPESVRGKHAHKEMREIVVALQGGCTIEVDDGKTKEEVSVNDPHKALFLPARVWRTLKNFEPDTILLLIADSPYDESDYIRDYDEFLKTVS